MAKATQPPGRRGANKNLTLTVNSQLIDADQDESRPQAFAYAFTRGGRLLNQGKVTANGTAKLSFPTQKRAQSVRVMVGPEVEKDALSPAQLLRRGAVEQLLRIEANELQASASFSIIRHHWLCWLRSLCQVQGELLRKEDRQGVEIAAAVCHAEVEIYEVDPIWVILPRIPDIVLERIRDIIIDPRVLERRLPELHVRTPLPPPPGPGPDPAEGRPALKRRFPMLAEADLAVEAPSELREVRKHLDAGSAELQIAARVDSPSALRRSLLAYPELVKRLLCLIYPLGVSMQHITTVPTDHCGRFSAWFFRGCDNPDTPDLYFKAKQRILFGFEVTIYAPKPVACHTHWNYRCGSKVTLYTTHPLARTCAPCQLVDAPPKWVLAMAIGNLRLDRIYGTSQSLASETTTANEGLVASGPVYGLGRPFGGLCRLHLEFDGDELRDAGVKYYRVSWRKKSIGGAFHDLSGSCVRHYIHEVDDELEIDVYPLGPNTVNGVPNLFEIPPTLPPLGQWSLPNKVEDSTSAKFPTHSLPPVGEGDESDLPAELLTQAGKYELKVELFKQDGSIVTDLGALGINYRVPGSERPDGSIPTTPAADLGLVSGAALIFTLHVDNNHCSAEIHPPTVNGATASDSCGVLPYTLSQTLTMPFSAAHPNNFATYRFRLRRGIDELIDQAAAVPGGSISETVDNDLLGPCAVGGVAAFAEHLYVHATATNGWRELDQYDASDLRAFVLVPVPDD